LQWHRLLQGDDADWEAYARWLEADPRHRQAFDEIALTDRIVEDHKATLVELASVAPVRPAAPARRRLLVGSLVAALAVAIGIPALWQRPGDTVYSTHVGETRRIALASGAAIDLAPSSRLVVQGGDTARLQLAEGSAYFDVRHDPNRALSIQAGDYAVSDIGTKFAIDLVEDGVMVGVSEGNVSVAPANAGEATRLSAGQRLLARKGTVSVSPVAARDVGSWRQGRLVYDNAPLSVVAADISRYSGKHVLLDPAVRDRRFSGVLVIGDGSRLLANLSDFMAISYRVEGDSVRLEPRRRP
jgi:transmembrane sensor